MNKHRHLKFPDALVLPARQELSQKELLAELGITRMTLLNYRNHRNFPAAEPKKGRENVYSVAKIAEFFRSHGTEVKIV